MLKITQQGFFGHLSFRGLFIIIALLLSTAFATVAAPYIVLRWQVWSSQKDALAGIDASRESRLRLDELRRFRKDFFISGITGTPLRLPTTKDLPENELAFWQTVATLDPGESAGRRRATHFHNFNQALDLRQEVIARRLDEALSSKAQSIAPAIWLRDLPTLLEALARLDVLTAIAGREGGITDKIRPELSSALAIAKHALASINRRVSTATETTTEISTVLQEALASLEAELELSSTVVNGIAISNTAYQTQEIDEAIQRPLQTANSLSAALESLIIDSLRTQRSNEGNTLFLTLFSILVSYALTCGALYLAYHRLSRGIEALTQSSEKLSTGDLSADIIVPGKDELQRIASSLTLVRNGMRTLVAEVVDAAHALTSASLSFAAAATESAARAKDQQRDTKSVVDAVAVVSNKVVEIVEAAEQTDEVARSADLLANDGLASVAQVREILQIMNSDILSATKQLDQLEAESNKVTSIVSVIAEIAEQTNLLALNAAIEAARAGESGRGFAVVADEVRKLAERTGASTKEIDKTLSSMRSSAIATADAVRMAASHIDSSDRSTSQAHFSIEKLRQEAALVGAASTKISDALAGHRKETEQIEQLVGGIAEMSIKNGQILATAASSAKLLEGLSEELRGAIGKFQLAERATPASGEVELF